MPVKVPSLSSEDEDVRTPPSCLLLPLTMQVISLLLFCKKYTSRLRKSPVVRDNVAVFRDSYIYNKIHCEVFRPSSIFVSVGCIVENN